MTLDYERLEGLISKFHWEGEYEGKDGDSWQLVWSAHRNSIDEDFYFDGVLRNFGHEVKLDFFREQGLLLQSENGCTSEIRKIWSIAHIQFFSVV